MNEPKTDFLEVRERAVRMVFEHEHEHASQWPAVQSIAEKIGCSGETLRNWVRQAERNQGKRAGLTTMSGPVPRSWNARIEISAGTAIIPVSAR